jgi:hypothetical protein
VLEIEQVFERKEDKRFVDLGRLCSARLQFSDARPHIPSLRAFSRV